jgi:hypothetical protein
MVRNVKMTLIFYIKIGGCERRFIEVMMMRDADEAAGYSTTVIPI